MPASGKKIPVIPTFKVAGHLKAYVGQPLSFLEKHWKDKGDIFRFRLAHRSLIVVSHPDYIKHILQENHTNYKKSLAYRKLRLLLGDGLFTSEGDYWLRQRRLAQPSFHKERIAGYFDSMVTYTEELISQWKLSSEKKQTIAIHEAMTELTLKIISKTLLGIDINEEGRVVGENLPYALNFMIKRVTSTINFPLGLPLARNKRFKSSVNNLYRLIDQIIEKKRENAGESQELLSMLMDAVDEETGQGMSNQQLKDEILTFFLAGHETSAVALSWSLYLLISNPEILNTLKKEVEEVLGDDPIKLADVKRLSYTNQVIKETLRLISPVWVLGREALKDDVLEKYDVKKGESIIFSPYLVHRHPGFWDNPEKFDPDRFKPEAEAERHKFAYFPFGGGPRLCIGASFALMEMQVILAMLIKNFDFKSVNDRHPGFNFSLTLRPKGEILAEVEPT